MKWLWTLALAAPLLGQKPDCSIVPGSKQQGEARQFDTDTLYEYMNGNSEGYFLYGFRRMHGVTCQAGPVTLIVDLSEFASPEHAYGMFTGNLDPRLPVEKIGAGGRVTPRKVIFVKGHYFAEIAAEPKETTRSCCEGQPWRGQRSWRAARIRLPRSAGSRKRASSRAFRGWCPRACSASGCCVAATWPSMATAGRWS